MSPSEVCYPRSDILKVLRSLNSIVVSLDRIGSSTAGEPKEEQDRSLAEFIVSWDVLRQLSAARRILSEPFGDALGDDDMDDLEREMQDVPYWTSSKRTPPA